MLTDIQDNCDRMNETIDNDIKVTTERLKSSRVLQEQVNREIMMFVKEKLAQFDNISIAGFDRKDQQLGVIEYPGGSACSEEWSMRMRALQ